MLPKEVSIEATLWAKAPQSNKRLAERRMLMETMILADDEFKERLLHLFSSRYMTL
jgi:hypothetical protein